MVDAWTVSYLERTQAHLTIVDMKPRHTQKDVLKMKNYIGERITKMRGTYDKK